MKTSTLFLLGCYAFVSLGVDASIIGPALPTLAARANVSLEQLGLMFTTMSLGYLSSAPIIHAISPRLGSRNMLVISPLVVVAAMLLLALGRSFGAFCVATFLLGLGQSGTQVTYNALFGAQQEAAKASAVLNRINAFFGVGALIGPLIVALGYSALGDATIGFYAAIVIALPLAIGAWVLTPLIRDTTATQNLHATTAAQSRAVIASPIIWVMCAVMGLYVGAEVAFSGWATEFTRRMALVSAASAAVSVSAFFGGLALSRYFTNALVRYVRPVNFLIGIVLVSLCGLVLMLAANTMPFAAYAGAFIVGAGFGPVYPTLVAIGIQRYKSAAQLVSSILTSAGSLGSIFLPSVTGYVLNGSSVNAWILLMGVLVVMLALWLSIRRSVDVTAVRKVVTQAESGWQTAEES